MYSLVLILLMHLYVFIYGVELGQVVFPMAMPLSLFPIIVPLLLVSSEKLSVYFGNQKL